MFCMGRTDNGTSLFVYMQYRIIDEKTGIVVNKGDYKSIANTINGLYKDNIFDSIDCTNRAKQFSKEKMINKYKELYESLLVK